MKVIHLATVDTGNGAAIAAYRLHHGLQRLGVDSQMFVAQRRTDDPHVITFRPPADPVSRLRRRLRRERISRSMARYRARSAVLDSFSDDRSPHGADVLTQLPPADIINVHAMLDFIDYGAFFGGVSERAPVVRTLHDMSFFTGGCHYDGNCDRYTQRCGACPQLGSSKDRDLSRQIWERKAAALGAVRPGGLHIVATSTWLAREAQRSSLLRRFPVTVIPYALDVDAFRPRDRRWAREVLGIPQTARVVLFVAEPVTRRLKGFTLLAKALDRIRDTKELFFLSAGSGEPPVKVQVPHLHLGQIRHERLLSIVYSAADVFVIPSLQEAFGLTALEATACGTPVIGFAVGGIEDTVRPGITGSLVPAGDIVALGEAIAELLANPAKREEMAVNCRRIGVEEYGLQIQAQRYTDLYRSIVHGSAA